MRRAGGRTGHVSAFLAVLVMACAALVGCATAAPRPSPVRASWVNQSVSFPVGGVTVYGTYRHPTQRTAVNVPAVLLIAGSGATDRNGNNPGLPAQNTLRALAERFSADGVASLRYDKLGSGQTALGPYSGRSQDVGFVVFEQEAAAALTYLADQPGIDRHRIAVFGHSEGALLALLLATGQAGHVPPIHALGLLEPASQRELDVLNEQVQAQLAAGRQTGLITQAEASQDRTALAQAITSLRATGTLPTNLPPDVANVFAASTPLYLSQADHFDPTELAGHLSADQPVLVTCSTADTRVSCADVQHLTAGLATARTDTDFVHLVGADHGLTQLPSPAPTPPPAGLPLSPQLQTALTAFVTAHL